MLYVFCFLFLFSLNTKVLDQIVAKVDGEPIFLSELNKRAKPIIDEYSKILKPEQKKDKIKIIKSEVLDQLIEEKLLLQEAKRKGIKVSDREVENALGEIKSRFKTEKEYFDEMKKQGISLSDMKKRTKQQLMIIKLIDMEVKSKIDKPTNEEAKTFYKNNESQLWEPEKVRVRHILIRVSSDTPKDLALKKARKVLALAKKGEDFAELARKYSEGPSSVNGGDLGFFARGDMVPEFEKVAFSLKVGEISGIVKTKFGYHIIKCIGKKAREKKSYEDVKDDIKNYIFQMRFEENYQRYIRKLRDKATIEIKDDLIK